MTKNNFPMRVVAFDADGIQRNVSNLHDIAELAKEKAERYADDEARRYLDEHEADTVLLDSAKAAAAEKVDSKPVAVKNPTIAVGAVKVAKNAPKAAAEPAAKAKSKR